MKSRYYVAYGSNLNVEQMRWRCPDSRLVGTAEIKDYELLFKGSKTGAYLTIEKRKGASVPVVVWKVSEADEKNLDRYEGYPNFYYKKEMPLDVREFKDGKVSKLNAFVYIMHEERLPGVPSGLYMETCLDGYRCFGFDSRKLMTAYRISVREARR